MTEKRMTPHDVGILTSARILHKVEVVAGLQTLDWYALPVEAKAGYIEYATLVVKGYKRGVDEAWRAIEEGRGG